MPRRVVITGSAAGIGHATAAILRERGDSVLGVDLQDAEVVADLGSAAGRVTAVDQIATQCDPALDALITCAGVCRAGTSQVGINFFGTIELLTGLRPLLATADAPRVALVGSISGTQPCDADLVQAMLDEDHARAEELARAAMETGRATQIYPSTKAALVRWMRRNCTGPDWAGAGIAMNAIAPGVTLTGMNSDRFADPKKKQAMDSAVPMPLNGYAEPEAIAHALLWLIASENSHMTGQVVYVDGGAETCLRPDDAY